MTHRHRLFRTTILTNAVDPLSDPNALAAAVLTGDRRALARAITLVESTRSDHQSSAGQLIDRLLPHTGRAIRLGITGVPGVGKSTFIEAFGLHAIGAGHRVAVLAVDPSSQVSGGSILGDKTRMEKLARAPAAFIRPSPTAGTLGGVTRRTREAMLICEAAGFDAIVVETVGVGQSETAVAGMVDMFLLLLPPAGGDELQGIKKGVVELADLIVVNKADGDLVAAAGRAAADYQAALHLLRPATPLWRPPVLQCSALEGRGIDRVWETVGAFRRALGDAVQGRRTNQARAWLRQEIGDGLMAALLAQGPAAKRLADLESAVAAGQMAPPAAARDVLEVFLAR
ncbi:MAG: methylmalonyl Co-A mutase-associated GTPase MeaB [Alphaproteobacteria bacterium]|nr:methylmalonyl Co-A mutase-associated GTPase MeaB [Alphaproteobacteria bacterium]